MTPVRIFAYMTKLWIEGLLGNAPGKQYAKEFDQELGKGGQIPPKGGRGQVIARTKQVGILYL